MEGAGPCGNNANPERLDARAPLGENGARTYIDHDFGGIYGSSGAPSLRCYRTSPLARLPEYGSMEAAGLDLFSARVAVIPPGERRLISTDLAWEIPPGCYVRIAPRSGLAWRHHIDVQAGGDRS